MLQSVALVIATIGTPFQLLLVITFALNAKTQQLKNRVPDLSIFAGGCSLVQFVISLMLVSKQDLCSISYWIAHLYIPCCSLPLILRSWTVYFAWHYNEAKLCKAMKLETSAKLNHFYFFNPSYDWFINKSFMMNRKTRHFCLLVFIICHLLVAFAFYTPSTGECFAFDNILVFEVLFIVYIVINGFMIKLLFTVSTSLGIFRELLSSTVCWAIFHAVYFALRYNNIAWADSVIAILIFFLNLISFGWPLYEFTNTKLNLRRQSVTIEQSNEMKSRGRQNTKYMNNNVVLKDCLKDPKGLNDFKVFLAKEFSVENILFWEKVEHFKNQFNDLDQRGREALANIILDEYIAEYATSPINVDYKSVKQLREDIRNKKITVGMFDHSQHLLYQLMSTDSYRRFLLTAAGKRYRFFSVQ